VHHGNVARQGDSPAPCFTEDGAPVHLESLGCFVTIPAASSQGIQDGLRLRRSDRLGSHGPFCLVALYFRYTLGPPGYVIQGMEPAWWISM